jgi:ComF family protein
MFVARLLDALFPPRESELRVRNATYDALASALSPTATNLHGHTAVCLLPYQQPIVQACIVEAKFHNNKKAFLLLSHILGDYLFEALSDTSALANTRTVLIPVPLSDKRYKERGYNQVEKVLRELTLSNEIDVRIDTTVLKRERDTAPQTTLPKHGRVENIRGAFSVRTHIDEDSTYLVIDDVTTTGATLTDALRALTSAGAKKVSAVTLAH